MYDFVEECPVLPLARRHRTRSAEAVLSGMIRVEQTVGRHPPPSASEQVARGARLRRLVDRNFDFVWRSARRLGYGAADADDVTQEVFIVAARRLDEIEPDSERSFLFGAMLRVAATRRRADRRRRGELGGDVELQRDAGLDPEQQSQLASVRPLLQEILDGLPPSQHAVFVLYELEELSLPEVADLLGIPVGTATSRLKAARDAFRAAADRFQVREQAGLRLSRGPKR